MKFCAGNGTVVKRMITVINCFVAMLPYAVCSVMITAAFGVDEFVMVGLSNSAIFAALTYSQWETDDKKMRDLSRRFIDTWRAASIKGAAHGVVVGLSTSLLALCVIYPIAMLIEFILRLVIVGAFRDML